MCSCLFRWSAIASKLPGRTDNDVKNYWNTKLKKKIMVAGKVSLKTLTENDTLLSTSTPLPTNQKNSPFNASPNQLPLVLPILEANDSNAFTINQKNIISFDQTKHHGLMHGVSQIGASSRFNNNTNESNSNSHMVSLSQEGSSSISDSSSIAVNYNKCVVSQPQQQEQHQQQQHVIDESMEMLMDFGFGFPYDFSNCHYERVGETFAPEWVDFSYADIKPH